MNITECHTDVWGGVEDRRPVSPHNPIAWLLSAWEWLSCRASRQVLIDTKTHGEYFVEHFLLPAEQVMPNKVFQILTAGRPLATRDSEAIRELVSAESCGRALVPPAAHAALVAAIKRVADEVLRRQE